MEQDIPLHDPRHAEHEAMRRRVLWKIDIHTIPGLTLLWLAAFIDRSNIGNARVAGLSTDLKLKGLQFNTALAVFYVTYIAAELPSNLILKRIGGKVWLPTLVFGWGLVTLFSGWMESYASLLVVRLLLGLLEGGLLPGMILYLSTLYKRHELQLRVGCFYSASSLSGAFGGLLAFGIEKMDGLGGRPGWAWIFILEGIATCVVAVFSWRYLPNGLAHASFLTREEREFAVGRSKLDMGPDAFPESKSGLEHGVASSTPEQDEKANKSQNESVKSSASPARSVIVRSVVTVRAEAFEWGEVIRGFKDPQVWLTGWAYQGICVSLYSYSLFLPTIVAGMGRTGASAQLFSSFPYIPASILVVFVAIAGDRFHMRGPLVLMLLPLTVVGYILAIVGNTNAVRYAGVFFMAAGIYPSVPALLAWLPNNTGGMTKRATVTALQLMITNTAGFIATFIYTTEQAPKFIRGHTIAVAFVCMAWILVALNCLYCGYENRQRAAGKRDHLAAQYRQAVAEGKTKAPVGDRSPHFRFTL